MSNNTSNYQVYTFPKLLEQYDKMLVPMIQRDYAQGRTDKKATDVRNNLLTDIFSGMNVHFDLVFGSNEKRIVDSKEMNCFIPVDGQQRLTTLFLLYLYGEKVKKIDTELDLSKFSYDTRRAASDFCKSITSEEWSDPNDKKVSEVIKDSSWFMNYWEKDPTVEGMLNMLDAIHEKCKGITDYPNLNKVTFFFFDLESNGLNENLYLKMNSRGKPLTAFENLKAKMEKILPEDVEFEDKCFPKCDAAPKDSFKEKWKYFMDRDWTKSFWDSENPDKYDVSIAKFIARFLAGYWAAFGKETAEETTAEDLKNVNRKEQNDKNYADYIQFEPIEKVLKLENAISSLAYALTTVINIAPYWANDTIKVSNKSEYKFLAVVFTFVLFDGDKDAMRFAWNMAENYVTEYDTFVAYCKRAGEIYKFNLNNNSVTFYKALSSVKFVDNISDQLKEEVSKANKIVNGGSEWKHKIIEAEKYAFFKGAIRFLFTDGEGNIKWCHFDTKWENAQKYFKKISEQKNVMNKEFDNANLLKALISRFTQQNYWDVLNWRYRVFNNYITTWRYYLLNNLICQPVHEIMMGYNSIKKLEYSQEEAQNRLYQLSNTDLLNFVIVRIPQSWIRYYHGHIAIFPSSTGVFLDADNRDEMLHIDGIKLANEENVKVPGTKFLYGSDIQFTYQSKYFQWHQEGYVRLIQDLNGCKPILKNKDGEDNQGNWYCFTPSTDPKEFINQLDSLIAQAYPNESDKTCCENCQNKISD